MITYQSYCIQFQNKQLQQQGYFNIIGIVMHKRNFIMISLKFNISSLPAINEIESL